MQGRARKAFTLIELLITISLIVVLVSVMTAALSAARTSAQIAETQSRLTALKQATVRFKNDIGYYPAVLDENRHLAVFPAFPSPTTGSPQQMYRYQAQDWYSITSPAEFLIGYGNQGDDGYGRMPGSTSTDASFTEMPRYGIRHPGIDGVWFGTADADGQPPFESYGLRSQRRPSARGKLFGPYIEMENEQMFGRIAYDQTTGDVLTDPVTLQTKVFYPGDPGYNNTNPLVIVDTWGTPIRYYRALYPNPTNPALPLSGIARVFPPSNTITRPSLSDYFVLRPFAFEVSKAIDTTLPDFMNGVNDATGDTSTSMELQTGQFAYFSAGPDKRLNNHIRSDYFGQPDNDGPNATDDANADNIIDIGP